MKNKLLLIFVCLILLSVSSVSASDINQTNIDDVDNSVLSTSNDVNVDNVLSANENIDENYTLTLSNDNDVLSDEGEFVDSSEGYERLNAFRTENGVWQWNSDDTTKTVFNTDDSNQLKPLVRDTALEETAKIRAKELVEKFAHVRPDGSSCWTAFPDGYGWKGENCAMYQSTWYEVMESWKETNDPYDGQGHRRNMLEPNFNSVGVAGYKLNGVIYWAQDFGGKYNAEELTKINPEDVFTVKNNTENPEFNIQLPNDATGTFSVRVDGNVIDSEVLSNGEATITASGLSEGSHEVILSYGGDSNYYTVNQVTSVNVLDDSTSTGTFTDLNNLIQNAPENSEIKLKRDYAYNADTDDLIYGININKEISIDGQGHTIDGKEVARIFNITSNNVMIKNIKFINGHTSSSSSGVVSYNKKYSMCSIINCTFINNDNGDFGSLIYNGSAHNCTFINNQIDYAIKGGDAYNCTFINNTLDIGWRLSESAYNCTFINNLISDSSDLCKNAYNCTFINNLISYSVDLCKNAYNCTFINNTMGNHPYNNCVISRTAYNCTFINNTANDILDNAYNCTFINNTALKDNYATNGLVIHGNAYNCTFINNTAERILRNNAYNCTFINNTALGYVFSSGAYYNCTFINNSAKDGGGAISGGDAYNCTFINNSAKDGSGGAISGGDAYNCTFINNSAKDGSGGAIWKGSAYNCTFINNSADGSGGAIWKGSAYNCTFINNSAMYGGAFYGASTYNCTFINNSASSGSAITINVDHGWSGKDDIYLNIINSNIVDCHFDNNYFKYYENATNYGGTIYLNGYEEIFTYYPNEIIFVNNSISNCIFKNNNAKYAININSFANVSLNNNELNNELIYNNNGTITSHTSIIVLDNKTISSYSNEVMLTANIFDDNGNSIVCDDFNFTINNKSIKGTLEYDTFKANVTLDDGKYIVGAEVNNLTDNTVKIGIIDVNTTQEVIIITAPDVTKYYGDSKQLTVTVTKNGSPFADAEIKINLNGSTYTKTTDKEGKAYLLINLDSGVYDAIITYSGTDLVPAKVVKITVKPLDTETALSYINSADSVTLTANVNQSSASGNIVFDVNGKEYTSKISNSKAVCTLSNLEPGSYTVKAYYNGDINHKNSTSNSISFIIENNKVHISAPDLIKYYNGTERFVVTLKDKDNNAIANETVSITINGMEYTRTTNINGEASIAINLNSGVYPVTTQFNDQKIDSKVTVISTIQGKDITKIFRNDTQYYATFLDNKGNFLKNKDVTFNINGVFYTRTTNDKGVAKLNINLGQGDYIITAKNLDTGEERSNIVKVLPSIIENNNITKYYKNGTQYVVKILNNDGSVAGAGVNVTFNINGVFYTRTTNTSGYAKLNINLAPDEYIITAEYNGLKVSNTIKVLPVLSANDLTMSYKDGSKFEAKLLDGQGNAYASQTIKFNINGVFYDRTTDVNGIARLNINLMAGKYIITSMYNGAAIANEITIS